MAQHTASAPLVLLLYGTGGGGHKASARATLTALAATSPDLHVQMADASAQAGASAGDWFYNLLLSRNAVGAIGLLHTAIQFFWPLATGPLRANFRAFWTNFDRLRCVVSFIPMLNAVFAETLPPDVHLITVLTDFSHTYTHPWIQHPRQHIVAGTDIAYIQAISHSFQPPHIPSPSMRVTKTSGMVVHPCFYNRLSSTAHKQQLVRLHLNQHYPTVLVLFGGAPPTDTVMELVKRFLSRSPPHSVNVIAVCGKNRILFDRLTRWKCARPNSSLCITAFSDQISTLMQVSDVLVGKPGPGVVSEAFVSALPLILITGRSGDKVMEQEKDVLQWVRSKRIASIVHSPEQAAAITSEQISQMKEAIQSMGANNAVFEVRDLILNKLALQPLPPHETEEQHRHKQLQHEAQQSNQLQMHSFTIGPSLNMEQQQQQQQQPHGSDNLRSTSSATIPAIQAPSSITEERHDTHGSPVGVGSRRRPDSLSPTAITALSSHHL
ncbi:unnamed protein product [Agarophyton chilense]